jgi:DNA-binding XRE family transcriptional regulator
MGMTQQRFADVAGVGRRFLVELEKGKPSLEIGRVLSVCQAAGLKLVLTK